MSLPSFFRYRDFLIRHNANRLHPGQLLQLHLAHPISQPVYLRETGSDPLTFQELILDRVYAPVLRRVPTCRTLIDLGANIGLATLFLSAHYRHCRFLAVEPNPPTFALLERNLAPRLQSGQGKLLRAAVWSAPAALAGNPAAGQQHYSRFETITSAEGGIQGLPMAAILDESGFDTVDLLKIDIEGAEIELFHGDLSWLPRIQAMAIEFHNDTRRQSAFDDIMRRHGFQIFDDNPHTVIAARPTA